MEVSSIFCCGMDGQTFNAKFLELPETEQKLLNKVADRSWLTILLRYDARINPETFTFTGGPWGKGLITHVELPSIELYLLITCLDTLAGHQKYEDFDEWIKSQKIEKEMSKEEIINLYYKYKEDYGIGKNLKNLFLELPDATKNWLITNVRIRKFDIKTWRNPQDTCISLLKNLFQYFYYFRRNPYTHRSESLQTWVSEDIYDPTPESKWVIPASGTLFVLYPNKKNQKWDFLFRQGIDEATILRIIIHSVVLQRIGINVTEELIQAHISHLSRAHIFRAFKNETIHNSHLLKSMGKLSEMGNIELRSFIYHAGIYSLSDQATRVAISRYKINPLENGLQQMTIEYLNEITEINRLIEEFNFQNPSEIPNNGRQESIDIFLSNLMKNYSIEQITNWPDKVEMTNLWLVIRDPCYS